MSPEKADLLRHYRELVRDMDAQIADLRSGAISFLRGPNHTDASAEAIALAERQRASILATLDKEDPDGLTALEPPSS